jgi:hypothetical protein
MEGISELGDSTPEMNFGKWRPDSARSLGYEVVRISQ